MKMDSILYITYNEGQGHLANSQILPYLRGLDQADRSFYLISYEKRKWNHGNINDFERDGIKWIPLRYHQKPSLLATTFDILMGLLKGLNVVRKNEVQIIHARSYVPGLIAILIKKVSSVKVIFDMRGFMADEYADAGSWDKRSFKYRITKLVEKKLLKESDFVITLTYASQKILVDDFNIDSSVIEVIPCCVDYPKYSNVKIDAESFKMKLGLDGKVVMIYVGSLGGWYLTKEMIEFYKFAKGKIASLHFLILSNTPKEVVAKDLSSLKKDEYTFMNVKSEDIPKYLHISDFGVAFIKQAFSKKASSPIKFGEYLSAGLPIVTNTGIGDSDTMLNEKVAYVVKKFNICEYSYAIDHTLNLLKNRTQAQKEMNILVQKYLSLNAGIVKYRTVYDKLLETDN